MKNIALNPYLPGWEYLPDGEPHLFDGRVYVYGSHDKAHGTAFCQQDYVVWSAPEDDLSDWRLEGVAYRKTQDPHNTEGKKELWAPDVCRGTDGRYYLYYCLAFVPEIGVAVSDSPAGPFEFYGYVQHENGDTWNEDLPFDPGVLFEDENHIWLFSGFGVDPFPEGMTIESLVQMPEFKDMSQEKLESMAEQFKLLSHPSKSCSCLRLAPDMKTVLEVSSIAPVHHNAQGTSFEEHPFFEASSIRKIEDTYYFVYSSFQGNELCYATSKYPNKDYQFGGVIISNGDLGYQGNTERRGYTANNHGGMVKANGQWYIFYHRHTNTTLFSRQGCAEPITILPDGSIPQVEMTSCGLNGGPLPAKANYSAHISCNLLGPKGAKDLNVQSNIQEYDPFITEEGTGTAPNQYIHNLQKGSICGVKYMEFHGESAITLVLRGKGSLQVKLDSEKEATLCKVYVDSKDWTECSADFEPVDGKHAVYFVGDDCEDYVDFSEFNFI